MLHDHVVDLRLRNGGLHGVFIDIYARQTLFIILYGVRDDEAGGFDIRRRGYDADRQPDDDKQKAQHRLPHEPLPRSPAY